jgi:hypothetical protein
MIKKTYSDDRKFQMMDFINKTITNRYEERLRDYGAIENKLYQFLIFNSALIVLFIQYAPIKIEYFAMIIYSLIFLLLFIAIFILVYQLMPKQIMHLSPKEILRTYKIKDYMKSIKEISTEYSFSFEELTKIINKRHTSLKYSVILTLIALFLLFLYNIYFKIYGMI